MRKPFSWHYRFKLKKNRNKIITVLFNIFTSIMRYKFTIKDYYYLFYNLKSER